MARSLTLQPLQGASYARRRATSLAVTSLATTSLSTPSAMTQPPDEYPYRPDGWETTIYPMPSFPTLVVRDVAQSARWYRDVLGFADVFTMAAPNGAAMLAHLRWCKYADVLLVPARAPLDGALGTGVTLNFVTERAEDVAARARAGGAAHVDGPVDRPWNAREVTVHDPDGYRLNFTARKPEGAPGRDASFDEVVGRMRDARA